MKKIKCLIVTVITICLFGIMDVNALVVSTLDAYKNAIAQNSVESEIKLGADLNVNGLNGAGDEDRIIVNRNIVIDLNGNTITTGDYATITVFYYGNYTLTIKDSSDAKTGNIHSICDFNVCSTAPIVLLNTNNCDPEISTCDSKLVLEDITINTSNSPRNPNGRYQYLINVSTPDNASKYNIEMSNVKINNEVQALQLFAHNFDYNSISPILNLDIKTIEGNNIKYINESSEYKVSDILDPTKSELLIDGNVITDPEMKISNYNVRAGFIIREKSIADIDFDDVQYGYSSVNAKPITIKNNSLTSKQIKSVIVSDANKFIISGSTEPVIASGGIDNTSFAIKPVEGLNAGSHVATITVTDMDDNTYTAKAVFTVNKADIMPSVSIDGWFYNDVASTPKLTGNNGNGNVTYEYKIQGSSDTSYSTTVPTTVGYYTLRATIASSANYNNGVATVNFIIKYKVIEGDGQKHTIGKNNDAVFKINADKSLFKSAYLNDKELNTDFYSITEGSTIVTLKQDFLNNLLSGTYNLKLTFTDGGQANTTFVIEEKNPDTSDPIIMSIIQGGISLLGLITIGTYTKKKRYN